MKTWQTIRDKSTFEEFYESYYSTESRSQSNYDPGESFYVTNQASSSNQYIEGNGVSAKTEVVWGGYEESGQFDSSIGTGFDVAQYGGYTIVEETGFTTKSGGTSWDPPVTVYSGTFEFPADSDSVSSYSSSSTSGFWTVDPLNLTTTDTTTTDSTFTTSSTYATSTVGYTSTVNSASKTVMATIAETVTVTSNIVTGIDSDSNTYSNYAQSSRSYTETVTTTTTIVPTNYIEIGTVVSAEPEDWLWSFTGVATSFTDSASSHFLTNLATTFTLHTFWATYSASVVSFTPFSTTYSTTLTYAANSSTFEYNGYETTSSASGDVTTGDLLPKVTSSSSYDATMLGVSFSTYGSDSYLYTADQNGTFSYTTTTNLETTMTNTVLFGTGFDSSTGTISQLVYNVTSQTSITALVFNGYLSGHSYSESSSGTNTFIGYQTDTHTGGYHSSYSSSWQSFIASTQTFTVGVNATDFRADSITAFQRVPKHGGFYSPDEMKQTDGTGSNISIAPAIYYPFTSSVQSNVVVPIPLNTVAIQTDTDKTVVSGDSTIFTDLTTWNYSWSSFSLSWTSADSYTSINSLTTTKTDTVIQSSSSTASMATDGDNGGEYWESVGIAFGGYSPVFTAPEIGIYAPGGVHATVYDTAGNSTTSKIIRTALVNSTMQETVRIEIEVPGFNPTSGGDLPFVGYAKHDTARLNAYISP